MIMNWDIIKGNWDRAKGNIKATWGDLTDDEVAEMEGNAEAMAWKLQSKYGMTKEDAEKAIDDLADSLKD